MQATSPTLVHPLRAGDDGQTSNVFMGLAANLQLTGRNADGHRRVRAARDILPDRFTQRVLSAAAPHHHCTSLTVVADHHLQCWKGTAVDIYPLPSWRNRVHASLWAQVTFFAYMHHIFASRSRCRWRHMKAQNNSGHEQSSSWSTGRAVNRTYRFWMDAGFLGKLIHPKIADRAKSMLRGLDVNRRDAAPWSRVLVVQTEYNPDEKPRTHRPTQTPTDPQTKTESHSSSQCSAHKVLALTHTPFERRETGTHTPCIHCRCA